jgi:selenophosphate synthetase-related protein
MAGLVGSLAMLLECNRLGVVLDLDGLPLPDQVTLECWLLCFPCYAFLLCVPPQREVQCLRAFAGRGLTAASVGVLDDTGELRLSSGGKVATAFDLSRESVTNLSQPGAAVRPAGTRAAGLRPPPGPAAR